MAKNKHLYMQIIDYLKNKIKEGEILPEEKLPTQQELADLFNVSNITSKRALDELEKEGLIYRVRGSGSYLSANTDITPVLNDSNNLVALIIPFDDNLGGIIGTIKGATEYLKQKGYYLTVHNTYRNSQEEREILKELVEKDLAGIIFYPRYDTVNIDIINNLYLEKYPIVVIDKYFEDIPISYVVSDNFKGGYLATEHLIKQGHKKISYISGFSIESVISIRQRYFGYCKALKDNEIVIDNSIIKLGIGELGGEDKKQENKLKKFIKELLNKEVTAIQTGNDSFAVLVEKICMQMGLKIPEDIAIVGFDNIDLTRKVSIPITTIAQDFYKIGSKAAEIIVNMAEEHQYKYKKHVLPVNLIKRESTNFIMEEQNNDIKD